MSNRKKSHKSERAAVTLTEWEWHGLHCKFNFADGHAHYSSPPLIGKIIDSLGQGFRDVESHRQEEYETAFFKVFYQLAGQSAPDNRAALHYSSSTTIDLTGRTLRVAGVRHVGVITPTFDNIPLLLQRSGLSLRPIREERFEAGDFTSCIGCDAVVLVLPNNPTGWTASEDWFDALIEWLSLHGIALVVDFSFRMYSGLHTWDCYQALRAHPDLEWILIEDTGKSWSTAELKLGFAACSDRFDGIMHELSDELLLNVSPFVVELLREILEHDLRTYGLDPARELYAAGVVRVNRGVLREKLAAAEIDMEPLRDDARVSVEWLQLPTASAVDIADQLLKHEVGVLPGGPFRWENHHGGNRFLRVALARNEDYFAEGVDLMVDAIVKDGLLS